MRFFFYKVEGHSITKFQNDFERYFTSDHGGEDNFGVPHEGTGRPFALSPQISAQICTLKSEDLFFSAFNNFVLLNLAKDATAVSDLGSSKKQRNSWCSVDSKLDNWITYGIFSIRSDVG